MLAGKGRNDEVIMHYRKALQIKPDYAEAKKNLEAAQLIVTARQAINSTARHRPDRQRSNSLYLNTLPATESWLKSDPPR